MQAVPPVQACPQLPQFVALVCRFTSQPFVALPSQSAKPVLHTNPHSPAEHIAVAFAGVGQAFPQAPQLASEVAVFTSHPSDAIPLQFAKPVLQLPMAQLPAEHTGVALAIEQTLVQVPQWLTDDRRSVSQPSPTMPSQSP
jgi:hypothetical protein